MKEIKIELDDDLVWKLESRASELGVALDAFLAQAISQNADRLVRPKKWIPREIWDARVRGDDCQDCVHLASGDNPHGYKVAELRVSRLDLMRNQFVAGYCVLYFRRHVVEPYELDEAERTRYFEDLTQAGQAIAQVFEPTKMNYQILGNLGPHLHCHIQPRFFGDSEPGWPIDPHKEQVLLVPKEYEERVRAIQRALERGVA